MQPTDTLTLCRYADRVVELVAVDAQKRRGLIRALRGRPFGNVGSDVTSEYANVGLSYLTDIQPVCMAEVQQPIPVCLPLVVDAPAFS